MRRRSSGLAGVASVYIGSVVGAGFATGQEIWQFFAAFSYHGLWGVGLAALLLGVAGACTLRLARLAGCKHYGQMLSLVLGPGLAPVADVVLGLLAMAAVGLMLSGAGEVFAEHLRLPAWTGAGLTATVSLGAVLARGRGLAYVNMVFVPFLVVMTLAVSLLSWAPGPTGEAMAAWVGPWWPWAAVLYAAYNFVLAFAVLAGFGGGLTRGQEWGGMVGGAAIGFLALAVARTLVARPELGRAWAIPMLVLAAEAGRGWFLAYTLALWVAISTSVAGGIYALALRLEPYLPYRAACVLAAFGPLFLARFPFAGLVGHFYPAMGYLGLVLGVAVVVSSVKRR
ncbi:MAG: hypothetical protein D9V47_00110 [Clostridia bacterium]|nr:MAG: hypothetical protein D9V47_00110 [Clostridia bacterium]